MTFNYFAYFKNSSALIVGADCVVHFGPSCLTPTKRLPVLYIFENLYLEEEKFSSDVLRAFSQFDSYILVVSDLRFHQSASMFHFINLSSGCYY